MTINTITNAPILKRRQLLTLEYNVSGKAQASFDGKKQDGWWLRIDPESQTYPKAGQQIDIKFARQGLLYHGRGIVKAIARNHTKMVVSEPAYFETRPIRQSNRVDAMLKTSIIIMNSEEQSSQFITRHDNQVVNLSITGALVASKYPLKAPPRGIMLMLSLDNNRPYDIQNQIYLRGSIVREGKDWANQRFPYAYGIQFTRVRDDFEGLLENFISDPNAANQELEEMMDLAATA